MRFLSRTPINGLAVLTVAFLIVGSALCAALAEPVRTPEPVDRSPVDVVLTPDEQWLLTANQTSGTVSLVHVPTGRMTAERACGQRPAALTLTPDGARVLVSAAYAGTIPVLDIKEGKLTPAGIVYLGFEPRGIAAAPNGKTAYNATIEQCSTYSSPGTGGPVTWALGSAAGVFSLFLAARLTTYR